MKKLKSLFSAAAIACCSMLFAVQANATLITQSVYAGGLEFLTLEYEMDDSLIGSGMGVISTFDNVGFDLVSYYIPFADGFNPMINDFEAMIDTDAVLAGVEYFTLDVEDDDSWFYYFYYDAFSTVDNYLSIFDGVSGSYVWESFEDEIEVFTTVKVSEPSIFALFALAFGALMVRRRV